MVKSKLMNKLAAIGAVFVATSAVAAGGGADLQKANIDPANTASLQRGAANFMNYCSGCHSAQYVRYSTIGRQLDLSDEQLIDNLMFKVLRADNRRIHMLQLTVLPNPEKLDSVEAEG